ncbi:response regulator transcription factor [Leptothrix discophora]|uniref:Response regulator n=1 Tax=Leptothrix discophora TaxID=89 RepID=A0ABT9G5K6_LEPDI|nr:response regulator [Leptothrix discophora]MDP4301775.1 response regulator [Leptothrix discophora]
MKILIVEDQADLRQLMQMTLGLDDHELHEAADAQAGWDAALAQRPDLVLLDIMMPGTMDGLDLCRRLKADPRTAAMKVVLVSARGHRNDMQIGLDAGADDYLLKPYSPLRLVEVVEAMAPATPARSA